MAVVGNQLLAPESGWRRYDNTHENVLYSGSWTPSTNASSYAGTITTTTQKGASVNFSFSGTRLRIIARRFTSGHSNNIAVYLDGVLQSSFSVVGADTHQCLVYEVTGLQDKFHIARIENNYTSGTWFHFDALDVDAQGRIASLNELINAYSFIKVEEVYKSYKTGQWVNVGTSLPLKNAFVNDGMNDLGVLDRKPTIFTQSMVSNGALGIGKEFSSSLNLKEYIEILSLDVK
ncbi:hypothetical protein D3C74_51330 [compost metagenome]